MPNNKNILIAVDLSDASERAVTYVRDIIAGKDGFHVGLFHVLRTPRMLEWGGSEDPEIEDKVEAERERMYAQMEDEAKEKEAPALRDMQNSLANTGADVAILPVEFEDLMDSKHIAGDILKIAEQGNFGTIVVGRHSFSGWQRLFKHHVGENLVRKGQGVTVWIVE